MHYANLSLIKKKYDVNESGLLQQKLNLFSLNCLNDRYNVEISTKPYNQTTTKLDIEKKKKGIFGRAKI